MNDTNNTNHQFLTDNTGQKTAVVIPINEYEKMVLVINKYMEYIEMEESLIRAFDEVKLIKIGKKEKKSLLSFLDEC